MPEGQSHLDLLNLLFQEGVVFLKAPITNKEAQTLYQVWKEGKKDPYGKIVAPEGASRDCLVGLQEKGMIRAPNLTVATAHVPSVELTDQGKEVIRNIILYAEQSAFNREKKDLDYDKVYQQIRLGPGVVVANSNKIASKTHHTRNNWLKKACK